MALKLRTYQLGSPRRRGEGLRVGVVRYPPRGVRKHDYARLDYYDLWLPLLAPSPELLRWIHAQKDLEAAWPRFERRYRAEMLNTTGSRQVIQLLARMAEHTPVAVGCHCGDERHCHRSLLRQLVVEASQPA